MNYSPSSNSWQDKTNSVYPELTEIRSRNSEIQETVLEPLQAPFEKDCILQQVIEERVETEDMGQELGFQVPVGNLQSEMQFPGQSPPVEPALEPQTVFVQLIEQSPPEHARILGPLKKGLPTEPGTMLIRLNGGELFKAKEEAACLNSLLASLAQPQKSLLIPYMEETYVTGEAIAEGFESPIPKGRMALDENLLTALQYPQNQEFRRGLMIGLAAEYNRRAFEFLRRLGEPLGLIAAKVLAGERESTSGKN